MKCIDTYLSDCCHTSAWPENMQFCTPAILYVINMYVFRTIVLAAVVGRPAYQFIDAVYVRD